MTVYILGAGASCCTDAYRDFSARQGWTEDLRPPVMDNFFRVARRRTECGGALKWLEPILERVGVSLDSLEEKTAGCANIETVLSLCDLLERAIAHWASIAGVFRELPGRVVELCRKVRGWPIFGARPEETIVRGAQRLKELALSAGDDAPAPVPEEWSRALLEACWRVSGVLEEIWGVYAPSEPYMGSRKDARPGPCSNYSALLDRRLRAGDTVVSFNYDFLVDRVLEEKAGLRVDSWMTELPTRFDARGGPARLLMLHGSVLWYVERNGNENAAFYLGNPEAGKGRHVTFAHAVCRLGRDRYPWLPPKKGGETAVIFNQVELQEWRKRVMQGFDPARIRYVDPLIIPPTVAKELSRPEIKKLWCAAKDALASAREIYVIGYSFPASDTHVRDMVLDAGRRRQPHGDYHGVPVRIVTKEDSQAKLNALQERVSDAFPGADVQVESNDGFDEWVKKTS